jgi:A/G-specific adenine glycosylase
MLVPKSNASIYNSALIDLGALVCVARQPKCGICPVEKFCRAQNPQTLPVRKSRLRTKRLIEKHAFVVRRGKILLERSSTRWRGMWILPPLQRESANQRPVYKSIFPFTDHRVTLSVYARHREKIRKPLQSWVRIDSLDSIPMPSPHRKALRHLLSERVIER